MSDHNLEVVATHSNDSIKKIIQAIQTKPWEFSFHQLLFVLELVNKIELGTSKNSFIKLQANCNLSVPSSDFLEYKIFNSEHQLTVNQTSLIGLNGVLLQSYTERILAKLKEKNTAVLDFLNIFNERYFVLMHRAEKTLQLSLNVDPARNFAYVHAVAGISLSKHSWKDILIPYANLLWQKNKNSQGLKTILEGTFSFISGFTIFIEEFILRWIAVSDEQVARLDTTQLSGKILGKRARCIHQAIRMTICVDRLEDYLEILPGNNSFSVISNISAYYTLGAFKIYYKFKLNDRNQRVCLKSSARLGYNSVLR